MHAERIILVLNAGSSSLKFGCYAAGDGTPVCRLRGRFADGADAFTARDEKGRALPPPRGAAHGPKQRIARLLDWLAEIRPEWRLAAAGHRVVHGGERFTAPVRVDAAIRRELEALVPLAPLHMPHNLAAIDLLEHHRPGLPQVACFDTAFHATLPLRERHFALPREWYARGVRRYGFHGLSYEYIASILPDHLGAAAEGRIVVAHLGHGASLCALHRRRSRATTMGMTPLDGVPMATRPGALDPGAVLWLQQAGGLSLAAVEDLLNHHSGLLGLSGISADMRELLASPHPHAREAVDHFIHQVHRAIGSLAAALGGLDALIFTGGIGENAPRVREGICREAAWLGIDLDTEANAENRDHISLPDSAVSVWRLPTDEERQIARHTHRLLATTDHGGNP